MEPGSSVWSHNEARLPHRGSSRQEFDTVIIGAGITGLTCALKLAGNGESVCVMEQGRIGSGTTGKSSAHLTTLFDSGWPGVIKNLGEASARALATGMRDAIDQIDAWQQDYDIDCAFERVNGYYYAEPGQDESELQDERAAAEKLGFEILPSDGVPGLPFPVKDGFGVRGQAQFNPWAYVEGLAKAAMDAGVEIREEMRVLDYNDGEPCAIQTDGAAVLARRVVLATHTPIGRSALHSALKPWRSYLLVARLGEQPPGDLYWDMAEPYHYLRRIHLDGEDCLLVGGADHHTGETPEKSPYETLERYLRDRFAVRDIIRRSSAQYYIPVDDIPMVGLLPALRNCYVATGYNGDGLTLGTLAGTILAERIQGQATQLSKALDPLRLKLPSLPSFLKTQVQVAKHFIQDRLSANKPDELDSIQPGDGRVVHMDNRTWACARLDDGTLLKHEARCPHMGCVVQWNGIEKTWDCPCHGGRFDIHGHRLEGPPRSDLGQAD